MIPITKWFRKNDRGIYEHNHIEDGHIESKFPTPKCEAHKSLWKNGKWWYARCWLSNDVPPKIVY